MSGERFGASLEAATREWVEEGIIREDQRDAILDRERSSSMDEPGIASVLYAIAGLLLGAAGIALVATTGGLDGNEGLLASIGAAFALAGAGLNLAPLDRERFTLLGDALIVAGLVGLTASVVDNETATVLAPSVLAATTVAGAWRREGFVAPIAVIAFTVTAGAMQFIYETPLGLEDQALWLGLQALLVAALAIASKVDRIGRAPPALSVVAFALAFAIWMAEPLDVDTVTVELVLGGVLAVLLATASYLDLEGIAIGASIALAIDGVVFAFDVGGVLLGVGTLVLLAALAVWQAETLRGYLRPVSRLAE